MVKPMIKNPSIVTIIVILLVLTLSGCAEKKWGNAPDFSLNTLDGETINLSDFQGHVILLNFMQIQCDYCMEELPILKAITDDYAEIIVMSIDLNPYETELLQSLIDGIYKEYGISLDWYFGMDDGSIGSEYLDVGEGIPKIVIIDKNGNIKKEFNGLTLYPILTKELDKYV